MKKSLLGKKEISLLLLMIILVPIAGEIKFYPFNPIYRVSFGPPMFFIFLLGLKRVPAIICGLLAGLSVLLFRILLNLFLYQPFEWMASIHTNIPSFFYYFMYALVFFLLKIHKFDNRPWLIGLLGIVTEMVAGVTELVVEFILLGSVITFDALTKILLFAVLRSFFVIGLFSTINLREAKLRKAEMQNRNEYMTMLISNLYEETILLKKTVQHVEEVTKRSYNLYKNLQEIENENNSLGLSQQALKIAGEVHEIKKDNQRILSGLAKMISEENLLDYMDIHSLFSIIVRTNKNYAELLGKNIEIVYTSSGIHTAYHVYTFISIVSNLVANSVEAIKENGKIEITVKQNEDFIDICVHDNGPGVPEPYQAIIFQPGFTLKFDSTGKSSTGIGLTYVKELVEKLEGKVILEQRKKGEGASFTVRLPIRNLTRSR